MKNVQLKCLNNCIGYDRHMVDLSSHPLGDCTDSVPIKWNPVFNFAITSINIHQF